MRVAWTTLALAGSVLTVTGVARAQAPLTLVEALARAREKAPQIVAARLNIDEARGRLAGAQRLQSNPEVDGALGPRLGHGDRSTDVDFGVSQMFEPSSRGAARRAGATAAIDERSAVLEDTTRLALRDTAFAFWRAVHIGERMRLLARTEELATGVLQIADRRFRAGDIAVLDVNIARATLARVKAERRGLSAEQARTLGDLKQLLQLDGDVDVEGNLSAFPDVDASALLDVAARRPELRALEAAIREAEAERQLGRSFSRPDYGFGVRYEREEGNQILLGGLTVTLPLFARGQELLAVGLARSARLRAELDAARIRVAIEVGSALAAYKSRTDAVALLEREALPGLDENDVLATRSFEVGQLGLAELLLIRREILETRFQYLDASLEAALAKVDLDARAGVLK